MKLTHSPFWTDLLSYEDGFAKRKEGDKLREACKKQMPRLCEDASVCKEAGLMS